MISFAVEKLCPSHLDRISFRHLVHPYLTIGIEQREDIDDLQRTTELERGEKNSSMRRVQWIEQ